MGYGVLQVYGFWYKFPAKDRRMGYGAILNQFD